MYLGIKIYLLIKHYNINNFVFMYVLIIVLLLYLTQVSEKYM